MACLVQVPRAAQKNVVRIVVDFVVPLFEGSIATQNDANKDAYVFIPRSLATRTALTLLLFSSELAPFRFFPYGGTEHMRLS